MRNGGTAIWQGFDFAWAKTPHRVHRLGSWLDDLHGDDTGVRGSCASRFSVGRVPDFGIARTYIGGIRARDLHFIEGSSTVTLGATNGEAAEVDGDRVRVSVAGDATPVLRGFRLICTSHQAGIHPQGFGVQLRRIEVDKGALSFTPHFFIHAANSPDFVTGWRGEFEFEFEAMYTVIGGPAAAVSFRIPCDDDACAEVDHIRKERPECAGRVIGRPGFNRGTLGIRGFRWEQHHPSWLNRNGRFLRRFEAHLGEQSYDADSGALDFKPRMNFSNDGIFPYPVQARHRMWTTLIQYRDDRPTLGQHEVRHDISSGVGQGAHGFSQFELR